MGAISVLKDVNDEVRYIDPRWPGRVVKTSNEIAYEDNQGDMQFLRRTPLAGAFKFQGRFSQTVPKELLTYFTLSLGYLSQLICIGYAFGDQHVNQAIRDWLEIESGRRLKIVNPSIERIPAEFFHLTPQIELVKMAATDYLDHTAGIIRTQSDVVERQFADLLRKKDRDEVNMMIEQHMNQLVDGVTKRMVEWVKTLPWKDGSIDLDGLGLTMDEFLTIAREKVPIPSPEEALEGFLKQATGFE